jgi:metallo-beta-lactamase family protein
MPIKQVTPSTSLPTQRKTPSSRCGFCNRPKPAKKWNLAAGIRLLFTSVGHILGAAAAHISYASGNQKKLLVDSGDLGRYGRPILKDPERIARTDWLMVESTYGDRLHAANPEDKLAGIINKVADGGGWLLIPSFAVGRMQELIYTIRKLDDAGKIPVLPVHVDSTRRLRTPRVAISVSFSILLE